MKRTATTLMLLAGFGGGCVSPDGVSGKKPGQPGGYGTVTRPMTIPGVQGPGGEPVAVTPAAARGVSPGGVTPAAYNRTAVDAAGVQQVGFKKNGDCETCAHVPGVFGGKLGGGLGGLHGGLGLGAGLHAGKHGDGLAHAGYGGGFGGGGAGGFGPDGPPAGGILPVPGMGPPGAVAAVGAIVPGMQQAPVNMRTSIKFTGPPGMKITWQLPTGGFNDEATGLTAPAAYNFVQGQAYRLRLTQILPNFPGRTFYPTLQVSPATPKTITFLSHASVPITFTNEDFDQASQGNLVVKVIYLPDPIFQDFAVVAGAEEIVSTRLEPGADPVAEAQRRGTILAIIRIGNIDLENKASPAMTAPPPGYGPPPGFVPPPGGPGGPIMLPGGPGMPPPGSPVILPPRSGTGAPLAPVTPPPGAGSTAPPPLAPAVTGASGTRPPLGRPVIIK